MGKTVEVKVDAKSALYQFAVLLRCWSNRIKQAVQRDANAVEILSTPALPQAIQRVDLQRSADEDRCIRRSLRRKWTRRDEKRLNWIMGMIGGEYPACRVSKLISRFGLEHIEVFRRALDETRQDGIVSDVGWLVIKAKDAYEALLEEASKISQ